MQFLKNKAPFILVALLVAAFLILPGLVRPPRVLDAGIRIRLPEQVASWRGETIHYCHNEACLVRGHEDVGTTSALCPQCQEPLLQMSPLEKAALPGDTQVVRKRYAEAATGHPILVTIVLTGSARDSIHRPQRCLIGQGLEIVDSQVLGVDIEERDAPLDVMLLSTLRPARGRDRSMISSYYAYWFAGKGRETPHHLTRMLWMAWDRMIHGSMHRWAYIAVSVDRTSETDDSLDDVRDFLRGLYPLVCPTREEDDPDRLDGNS